MASASPATGTPLTVDAALDARTASSSAGTLRDERSCVHSRSSGRWASRAATRACA